MYISPSTTKKYNNTVHFTIELTLYEEFFRKGEESSGESERHKKSMDSRIRRK